MKTRLPQINAKDHNLERVSEKAWRALKARNNPPFLFDYAGLPCRIITDTDGGTVFQRLTQDAMTYELARAARFYVERDGRKIDAHPPIALVRDMLAGPRLQLPRLVRTTPVPIFDSTGEIVQPGYNPRSGILYRPAKGLTTPPILDRPTKLDVLYAVCRFIDVLGDFPFTGNAERTHAEGVL